MQGKTIILPAYNEEKAIGKVIDEIRGLPTAFDIVVADSQSTDRTTNIAVSKGATIVQGKRGKGNAVREALKHINTPYIFMVDSDYTYPTGYLCRIFLILASGNDVVMGYRAIKENGAMTLANKFGNRCLSLLASLLYRYKVKDVCTGMWGFRKEALDRFSLTSPEFTLEADLFVNAVKQQCRIKQIPINYRARLSGSKAKLRITDGFKIGWFLIKRRFS